MLIKSFLSFRLLALSSLSYRVVGGAVLEKKPFVLLNNPNGASEPTNDSSTLPLESIEVILAAIPATPVQAAPTVAPATPTPAADPNLSAMPPTAAAGPLMTPAPSFDPVSSPSCTLYEPCNLFYQYVNVFYWPEESASFQNNTACLSPNAPAAIQPDISNIQSPSVYVIFPSIIASNGCSNIGSTFADITKSFAPDALSTIGLDHSTYSFNFGDLPCPPPDKGWDPTQGPYKPLLAPPDFLFKLDPAFSTCIPGASQGIDPYSTLTTANAASGPGKPCGPHCGRHRRALEHAHPVRWAPKRMAELV